MLFDVICEQILKKLHEWDPIVNFGDSDSSNCCVNWCLSSSSWGDHEGRSGISFPGILEKFLVCPVVFRQFPESFPRSLNACPMTFHQLASSQNLAKFPRKLKNPIIIEIYLGSVVLKSSKKTLEIHQQQDMFHTWIFIFFSAPWIHEITILSLSVCYPIPHFLKIHEALEFFKPEGRWKSQEGSGSKGFGSNNVFLSFVGCDRWSQTQDMDFVHDFSEWLAEFQHMNSHAEFARLNELRFLESILGWLFVLQLNVASGWFPPISKHLETGMERGPSKNGWYLRCVKETYLWVVTIWWHSSFLFYDFSMICGYLSRWGNMDIKGVPLNFLTFKFTVRPWSNNLLSTRIILRNHMGESQISNSTETQTNPAVKNRL